MVQRYRRTGDIEYVSNMCSMVYNGREGEQNGTSASVTCGSENTIPSTVRFDGYARFVFLLLILGIRKAPLTRCLLMLLKIV